MSESDVTAPSNNIQGKKVPLLATGPGGKNSTLTQMNKLATSMAMVQAQADKNAMYDGKAPPPQTSQIILRDGIKIEGFCSNYPVSMSFAVVGTLFFVYGLVAK